MFFFFGPLFPPPAFPAAERDEIGLAVVPCLAADRDAWRLGRGGGYYDRFLAEHPGRTACLCFRALLRADLPMEETDIVMDLVISD